MLKQLTSFPDIMHRLKNMHDCNYDVEEKVASEPINAPTAHSISNVKNLESLIIVFLLNQNWQRQQHNLLQKSYKRPSTSQILSAFRDFF